jgi:transitional endoplasmic reticulum ATPase
VQIDTASTNGYVAETEISPALSLAGEYPETLRAVELVGQILTGSVRPQGVDGFLLTALGLPAQDLVSDSREVSSVGHITTGLAIAALIERHNPKIGPSNNREVPTWGHVKIGENVSALAWSLSAAFPAGTIAPAPLVVRLAPHLGGMGKLDVYTSPADRAHGVAASEAILADADSAKKNLYLGKALTAKLGDRFDERVALEVVDLPAVTRSDVIVPASVWAEIDLNIAAVTTQRELMTRLGLGLRRGVLLAGPPGVGKTAISQVLSRELVGEFTVINVDARAGRRVLGDIYNEARAFGPTVIVLEDLDLIVGDRRQGDHSALSEFLTAMDTDPAAPILTLASTNDVTTLDAAAIRNARFDSIIEIGYPDRDTATQILATYLRGIPGGDNVDTRAVAATFNPDTSGADIREICRRCVLADGAVTQDTLLATVKSGRFKAELPQGSYL